MNDDMRRRIEEAARRPVPPPDPAFADALEARLRAVAASLPPAPSVPRRRIATRRWLAVGAVIALVAAVAVTSAPRSDPNRMPGPGPALAGPVNVAVSLVDGTVLEDPDGLLLPEGASVTVGEGGSARIGDTALGPGDIATIEAGGLVVRHPSPVAAVPDPAPTRTPRPDRTPAPATDAPSGQPPEATPSPAPRMTGSPPSATEPAPATARTGSPVTTQPTPTPTPAILRPRLRVRLIDGPRIAVRWTETWSAAGYVLVATSSRSGPAPDPVYPGSRVIGAFARPPDLAFRIRVPDGVVEVRLMVVALRDNGRVLRRSRIMTIPIPPPGDTTGSEPSPTPTSTVPAAS